jgi:serpin B
MILWTKIKMAAAVTLTVGLGAAVVVAAANLTPEKTAPAKVSSSAPATPEKPVQPAAPAPAEAVKALAQGNNEFALEMYAKLKDEPGNLFFSPFSLRTALGMTYAGARGETAAQMEKTLRFKPQDPDLHAAFGQTIKTLEPGDKDGYKLTVANSLWGQKDFGFLKPFLATCNNNYDSGLTEVDFKTVATAEESRGKINLWVEDKTNQKIKNLIPEHALDPRPPVFVALVLVNAIWFKGDWQSQFKKDATKNEPFWTSGTEKTDVPLMRQTEKYKYLAADGTQILELPYVGEKVSMVAILPKEKDGLGKMEAGLTAAQMAKWLQVLDGQRGQKVEVYLPRFKVTYGTKELGNSFKAMGMELPFDTLKADFSGMNGVRPPDDKALRISKIFHQAFVDVNEEGTEAAAATAVVMAHGNSPPPPLPVFRADHPFIFLIRDKTNGNILFMGRLAKP